jgi:tripeptidyl-peptidase-2
MSTRAVSAANRSLLLVAVLALFSAVLVPVKVVQSETLRSHLEPQEVKPKVAIVKNDAPVSPIEAPPTEAAPVPNAELKESIYRGLMPRQETQAFDFLKKYPDFDGRGVTVAIFDTGVDPGAIGLQTTPDGRPKVIDMVDGTGSGDVDTSHEAEVKDGKITGLTGRTLTIPADWKNPGGKFHLGMKHGFDLFPTDDAPPGLKERMEAKRHEILEKSIELRSSKLMQEIAAFKKAHPSPKDEEKAQQKELEAKLEVLGTLSESLFDAGPVYDCIVFNDGDKWRAAVDTDEDGDFADEKVMTNFRAERQFSTFADPVSLNFALNIYENGNKLSIVCDSGAHGTHVAGIVSAYHEKNPELNGVAPGAQIVSVKIGDTRIKGMETGPGLEHGVKAVIENHCDLVNMSYGESSSAPNKGYITRLLAELVYEHNVIFVSSAGNSGPALSTVGAPGGTSSAMLGIGAYLPPDLMRSAYTFRNTYEGIPYTWTSRGPTFDGDWGVDLLAPGGAVAPMPSWVLQKHELYQGTSMASPNACGCIALMLSAAKGEKVTYSPGSVRRALQSTAEHQARATAHDEGAGLVQTLSAYESLKLNANTPGDQYLYEVNIPQRNNARGIYLREPSDLKDELTARVYVEAKFPETASNKSKIEFELPVRLESTADWIESGDFTLLTHGANYFEVKVNPTGLEPGVHFAEIQGFDNDHPERGAMFRVPVTVIKPHMENEYAYSQTFDLKAGDLTRLFLVPPPGTTTAHVKFTVNETTNPRTLMLHALQMVEGKHFEAVESQEVGRYQPGRVYEYQFPIVGGRTLEYCAALYWNDVGSGVVDWSISFSGIQPSNKSVSLTQGQGYVPIDVVSANPGEPVSLVPQATLKNRIQTLRPGKVERTVCDPERFQTLKNKPIYSYKMTYNYNHAESGEITVTIPRFEDQLYDAEISPYFYQIIDSNGAVLTSNDMFPDPFKLPAGDFEIVVDIHNPDIHFEKTAEALLMEIESELSKPVKLSGYGTTIDAAMKSTALTKVPLLPQQVFRFYLAEPTNLPAEVEPGNVLTGTISYDDPKNLRSDVTVREYGLNFTVTNTKSEDAKQAGGFKSKIAQKDTPLEERLKLDLKQLRLIQIKAMNPGKDAEGWKAFIAQVEQEFPDTLDVRYEILQRMDGDDRDDFLPEIVTKCDEILKMIDMPKITGLLTQRAIDPTEAEKTERTKLEEQKKIFLDVLYRRARALGYMESADNIKKHPIADMKAHDEAFAKAYKELSTWVDVEKDAKTELVAVRNETRQKHYAQALKILLSHKDQEAPEYLHVKKMYHLLQDLGWDDLAKNVESELLKRFPREKPPWE